MKDLNDYINKATQNIKEDRAATKALLITLLKYMTAQDDRHKEVGMIAAKYVETLQRSNEQLVKLASLIQKQTFSRKGITEDEKDELFDMIQSEKSED
tara:strand:- start:928 stop:1221 length:294 start_codon:yes stop_codon:yes gene_type:complete